MTLKSKINEYRSILNEKAGKIPLVGEYLTKDVGKEVKKGLIYGGLGLGIGLYANNVFANPTIYEISPDNRKVTFNTQINKDDYIIRLISNMPPNIRKEFNKIALKSGYLNRNNKTASNFYFNVKYKGGVEVNEKKLKPGNNLVIEFKDTDGNIKNGYEKVRITQKKRDTSYNKKVNKNYVVVIKESEIKNKSDPISEFSSLICERGLINLNDLEKIILNVKGNSNKYRVYKKVGDGTYEITKEVVNLIKNNLSNDISEVYLLSVGNKREKLKSKKKYNRKYKKKKVRKTTKKRLEDIIFRKIFPGDLNEDGICDDIKYDSKTGRFYNYSFKNMPIEKKEIIGQITDFLMGKNYYNPKIDLYNNYDFLKKECNIYNLNGKNGMMSFIDKFGNDLTDNQKFQLFLNAGYLKNLRDIIFKNIEEVKNKKGEYIFKFNKNLLEVLNSAKHKLGVKDNAWGQIKNWVSIFEAIKGLDNYSNEWEPNTRTGSMIYSKILVRNGIEGFDKKGNAFENTFSGKKIGKDVKWNGQNGLSDEINALYKYYIFKK